MVAYSFKRQFVEKIRAGEKRQTIRAHRLRHARPGEQIQLYFGMRTRHCEKILSPDPVCLSVEPIILDIVVRKYLLDGGTWQSLTDDFARADGFADAAEMREFWRVNHGRDLFSGVLIKWQAAS